MMKIRRFRLGRRLVRLWRWVRLSRSKRTAYLDLTGKSPPSPSESRFQRHHSDKEGTGTTTNTGIAHWGRRLTRRCCPSSPRLHGAEGSRSDHQLACQTEEGRVHRRRGKKQRGKGVEAAPSKPPPKGHLVLYVGRKDVDPLYRVTVPVIYFNHPLFGELLREAQEEFGFEHSGGITIPCPISDFESVRTRVAATAGLSCRHRSRTAVCAGGR